MITTLALTLLFRIQLALFLAPDFHIAQGMYWTNFWLNVAGSILKAVLA